MKPLPKVKHVPSFWVTPDDGKEEELHLSLEDAYLKRYKYSFSSTKLRKRMEEINPQLSDDDMSNIDFQVSEWSGEYNIPVNLLIAIMEVESSYQIRAVSPKGAVGLMQINPRVWYDTLQKNKIDPTALFNPYHNVRAGAFILKHYATELEKGGCSEEDPTFVRKLLAKYLGADSEVYFEKVRKVYDFYVKGS